MSVLKHLESMMSPGDIIEARFFCTLFKLGLDRSYEEIPDEEI